VEFFNAAFLNDRSKSFFVNDLRVCWDFRLEGLET